VTQFANDACATYQKKNTRLAIGLTGNGKQMNHRPNRPEQACTIYCEQSRSHEFLSPQPYFGEKDDIDLFFPDGTWCHNDGSEDYFCLKHQCISESQSRQPRKNSDKPEVQIFQNAQIEDNEPDKTVIEYFTVDKDGNPKSEAIPKSDKDSHKDDDKTDFDQDDEINPQKRKRSPETKEHRNPREYEPDEEFEMSEPMFMPGFNLMTFAKPHEDKSLIDMTNDGPLTEAPDAQLDIEPLWDLE
jgi:hypothetical protein